MRPGRFRPERGQHNALDALTVGLKGQKVNWVLDADIRSFFDEIDHGWMLRFLEHRIADQRILNLIRKWLLAGVVENGQRMPRVILPEGGSGHESGRVMKSRTRPYGTGTRYRLRCTLWRVKA